MKHHLLLPFVMCPLALCGQTLTAERHVPQTTDSLLAYKTQYIAPSDTGRNCLWNFSELSTDSAEVLNVDYYAAQEDTAHIGLHREHANYYYHIANDTLWLTGYETSRAYMHYAPQIPQLRFPFAYGDTLCGAFAG